LCDPTNIAQWEFYVVATKTLNDHISTQKRIDLKGIENWGWRL